MGNIAVMWTLPRADRDIKQKAGAIGERWKNTACLRDSRLRSERYLGWRRTTSDDSADLFNRPAHHWLEKTPRTLRRRLHLEPSVSPPRREASRRALTLTDYLAGHRVRGLVAGFVLWLKLCRDGVLLQA